MATATAIDVASLVDDAAGGRVLIVGSLPPGGRDLDVLARLPEGAAVATALAAAGFAGGDGQWARFGRGLPDVVELLDAADWRLPAHECAAIFDEAVPLDGYSNLARPAPHHVLLILARLTAGAGTLPGRRRRRVEAALAEDAAAWRRARARAGAWRAEAALDLLERVYRTGEPAGRLARVRAAGRAGLPRPRRPSVIAFSGIDGAGKSSQAALLRDALERLGYEVAVEWRPLGQNEWLDRIARPVKRLVAPAARRASRSVANGRTAEDAAGSRLRERSRLVNDVWATAVAMANGASHASKVARHVRGGRIVIFDRYTLDSVVRLRFLYGERRSFRLQRTVIRLLSPRALVSFLLSIDPETSLARKDDRWSREELATQARLYDGEAERYDALRLDGARPRDELAGDIAELAWRRLTRRPRRWAGSPPTS